MGYDGKKMRCETDIQMDQGKTGIQLAQQESTEMIRTRAKAYSRERGGMVCDLGEHFSETWS